MSEIDLTIKTPATNPKAIPNMAVNAKKRKSTSSSGPPFLPRKKHAEPSNLKIQNVYQAISSLATVTTYTLPMHHPSRIASESLRQSTGPLIPTQKSLPPHNFEQPLKPKVDANKKPANPDSKTLATDIIRALSRPVQHRPPTTPPVSKTHLPQALKDQLIGPRAPQDQNLDPPAI